jgi:hypothetical protein
MAELSLFVELKSAWIRKGHRPLKQNLAHDRSGVIYCEAQTF